MLNSFKKNRVVLVEGIEQVMAKNLKQIWNGDA